MHHLCSTVLGMVFPTLLSEYTERLSVFSCVSELLCCKLAGLGGRVGPLRLDYGHVSMRFNRVWYGFPTPRWETTEWLSIFHRVCMVWLRHLESYGKAFSIPLVSKKHCSNDIE